MTRFGNLVRVMFVAALLLNTSCRESRDVLSGDEQAVLNRVLAHWETWMPAKKADGTAPLTDFTGLYQGLGTEEQKFLEGVRAINPRKNFNFQGHYLGEEAKSVKFTRLDNQWIERKGKKEKLDPQYLPDWVSEACERMMKAMEQDLGKRLLVESGYRSPAYQLYTFLYYMPKHRYSLVETGHWIALPGYSEHGWPFQQAIDFMNQQGINGEDRVEDFEQLPEYAWLRKRAGEFGFELSYPRGKKGITFEPWHWRYLKKSV